MRKTILTIITLLSFTAIAMTGMYYAFKEKSDPNILSLYGNVDVRQVDIGFRVSGLVTQLLFEEGDWVEQGALMCTLDKTPYDSQLKEAIANAKAIQVNLDHAEILFHRRLELIEGGGVSQEDVDNAKATRDQLAANLIQAKAAIAVAKDNLTYTRAYAPTDGILLTRIREPGTVVNAADPVYTLSVSSPIWIRAFVDEPQLGLVHYGMQAEIFTDIRKGKSYKGTIGFISPIAEFTPKTVETSQLRTDLVYRIRVYVDNPDYELVQGMPVTVQIHLKS